MKSAAPLLVSYTEVTDFHMSQYEYHYSNTFDLNYCSICTGCLPVVRCNKIIHIENTPDIPDQLEVRKKFDLSRGPNRWEGQFFVA